jgi:hypothetical protein
MLSLRKVFSGSLICKNDAQTKAKASLGFDHYEALPRKLLSNLTKLASNRIVPQGSLFPPPPFQVDQPPTHDPQREVPPTAVDNIQDPLLVSAQPDFATPSQISQRGAAIDEQVLLQRENIDEVTPEDVGRMDQIHPTANNDEFIRLDSAMLATVGNPQSEEIRRSNNNCQVQVAPHGREAGDDRVTQLDLSPPTPKREYEWAMILASVTAFVAVFTVFYGYSASIRPDPFTGLLASSSDNTTFTIVFLVQVTIMCLLTLLFSIYGGVGSTASPASIL